MSLRSSRPSKLSIYNPPYDSLRSSQNPDGGFATYENNRGYRWYEWLNPSEVFGDIMIDYSYVECSMASLTALADFSERYPLHRRGEVEAALGRGQRFMRSLQRPDGSWYGSWACCFCYGTWFGVEGLVSCGAGPSDRAVVMACDFLKVRRRVLGVVRCTAPTRSSPLFSPHAVVSNAIYTHPLCDSS